MFETPEHQWKTKTPNVIKSWIQKHKPLIQMAVSFAKRRQKINTPDIRTHLVKLMPSRKPKQHKPSTHPKKITLLQSSAKHIPGFCILK